MNCQHKGCERKATHAPVLVIPTMDNALTGQKAQLTLSHKLCREHAIAFEVSLTGASKEAIQTTAIREGTLLDFSRMRVKIIDLSDPSVKALDRQRGQT